MTAWINTTFLAPTLLWFLGIVPVIILLYFLKLRRTEIAVSSTMLWFKSLQDLTANAPFQRLRKNLLLLLQILVVILLAIALARPFIRAKGARGANLCLLIDCSASMQTLENGDTTRLDEAIEKALDIVNDLRGGDKAMVVAFAETAEVLCELTDNRPQLRGAINSITARDTATQAKDAFMLAYSLSRGGAENVIAMEGAQGSIGAGIDLRVIVLTDGRIADLDRIGNRALNVTYLQIGETRDNAGIVAFSNRALEEGKNERQAFVLVHNEDAEALDTTLSLYFNDALLAVEEIHVPPEEDGEFVFAHDALGEGVLRAELDHEDALEVDNTAWLSLRPASDVSILLVTAGNSMSGYFLKRALTLEPRVDLSAVTPENYVDTDDFDLIIFDNFAPETLPGGSLLFFNALPPLEGIAGTGVIENPPVLAHDSGHALMRFLNPASVGVSKALQVALPPGARTLLSTEGAPLIADVSRGGQSIALVAFDLVESDWPWHLSFPLFLQNLVAWAPRSGLAGDTSFPAGSPLPLMARNNHGEETEVAIVRNPSGETERVILNPSRPVYFGATERVGPYDVTYGTGDGARTEQYAVNLLSMTESSISPAAKLELGRTEAEAVQGDVSQNKELWRWFLFACLGVLMVEWWIYTRRAWI